MDEKAELKKPKVKEEKTSKLLAEENLYMDMESVELEGKFK